MSSTTYTYDLIARDKASSAFRSVGKSADGMGAKVKAAAASAAKNMGRIGLVAGVAAAKAVTSFTGFQGQMNEVFTLLPGISQGAMDAMSSQVKDFSKDFGVLPDKVVPALYQSLSAGVPKDNVFAFLETAQQAAKGGVTDLTTAVDGISSVVNAYGSDAISASKASDLMFTAVRLGKTNFEQLSASLSNVTPIASALGVKFEDVSAALAAMTAKGTPTAVATTQLRSLFVELSKAGGTAATAFEDIAGKSFQKFIAEGGNTAEALSIMERAAGDAGVQLQDMFGSVEAGAAALSLSGGDSFTTALDAMGESAGATEAAFDRMMTGLGPIFDRIKANLAVFMLEVGERLAPYVEQAISRVTVAFGMVSDWWDRNGSRIIAGVKNVRDAIVGWIDEVRPAIESWVTDVLGEVSDWWDSNGPTIIDVAETLRDTLVDAFRALQRAAGWVIDNWKTLRPILIGAGTVIATVLIPHYIALGAAAVKSSILQAGAWARTTAAGAIAAVAHSGAVVRMIAGWVAQGAAAVVSGAQTVAVWALYKAEAIKAAAVFVAQIARQVAGWVLLGAQSLLHAAKVAAAWLIAMGPIGLVVAAVVGLVAVVIKNWDTITRVISGGWQKVRDITSSVWGTISRWTSETWNRIKSIVGGAIDGVVGFVQGLPGRIGGAASGAFNGIRDAFRSALNWIVDAWNRLRFPSMTLPKVSIPGLGDIGGGTFGGWDLPNIPRFHSGGLFQAPGAGEGLALLKHNERVLSPSQTEAYDAGGQRVGVAFYGPITVGDVGELRREMNWYARVQGAGV